MKKVKVLLANNTMGLFNYGISFLKEFIFDINKQNIIIVPDRLSLIAEKKIFELLNINVYFNISVMGISKFAKMIISDNNLDLLECSNLESKLLTLRAIQNVKSEFKCFTKNYTLGLVDEIFAKIEQIKSSNVKIDDLLDENASIGTRLKYEDLKLIYNEYENLRANKLDSGAVLSLFNEVCATSDKISNCNVFFYGFDSMTKQGIEVVKNTVKNAHLVCVGVVCPNQQKNKSLYDDSFFNSILNMCKAEQIESEVCWVEADLKNKTANSILNNIYTPQKVNDENNYVNLYSAKSVAEEIDFVAKSINYNLKNNNLTYKDFAICAPDDYHEKISLELSLLGIDVFTDKKMQLINLEPIKYILNYLKMVNENNKKDYLLKFILNDYCEINAENKYFLINLLNQYLSIKNILKYCVEIPEEITNFILKINNEKISKEDSVENYLKIIKKLIKNHNIFEKINNFCNFFKNGGEIYLEKIYLQVEDRLNSVLTNIEDIIGNVKIKFDQFYEILEKAFAQCEISGVPSKINQVFVGNSKSFFSGVKYMYVLGCNDGMFPETLLDTGLITDKEINSKTIKAVLEPTTKIINKRNKFKALEVLLSASEKCYVVFHTCDKDGKAVAISEMVSELGKLLNKNVIPVGNLKSYNNINLEKLKFNNPSIHNANLNINLVDKNVTAIIKSALILSDNLYFKPKRSKVDLNFNRLFFTKNKVSVSLIEKFSACPKSAFLNYGLKLQKNKKEKIEPNNIGSFIHEVAEKFVKYNKNNLGKMNETQILDAVDKICSEIILKPIYYSILLEENIYLFRQIKKECNRFCMFINYEQTISNFKPIYLEKYFGGSSDFRPLIINVSGTEYLISGIVDRIDVCDNYFRVIDYKTGDATAQKGKDNLFYGTKVQLFVYAEAIKNNLNKKIFGTFYLPIKNSFSFANKESYSFSGFHVNNSDMAINCDDALIKNGKSEILNCAFLKANKGGGLKLREKNNIFSEEEFEGMRRYALNYIKLVIQKLEKGFLESSPLKGKCNICEFNKICKNAFDESMERQEQYAISNEVFLELNYEG